jgi:vacuolar-type H+-ATPase subunit D/Vma8
MEKEPTIYETSANSIASLDISKRDLITLRDRIDSLESSLRAMEEEQAAQQRRLAEVSRSAATLKSIFETLFGDRIRSAEEVHVKAEPSEECPRAMHIPGQITLGISEVTREQVLSVMDAIKRVSEESEGPASKEDVLSRAEEIGITREVFEDILARLRRAGALIESEGTIKLV